MVILAVSGTAACSQGDTHSEECGRGERCSPITAPGNAGGMAGGGNEGIGGSAGSDFGNNEGGAPVIPPQQDAGMPGVGETTEPDNPMCGGLEVEPEIMMEVIPGNILLVFDKSGSMCDTWSTGGAKWQDAHRAVATAIEPLKDNVSVAAIFFPDTPTAANLGDPNGGCYVPAFNSAPQIPFSDGASFLAAWDAYWTVASEAASGTCANGPQSAPNAVNGATPLLGALQVADAAIAGAGLQNTTNVVIITDGQPNCSGGDSRADEPLTNLTPTIAAWLTAGYKTYVVGLPGVDEAIPLLNGLATAGGTTQYIPANDPATLQANLAMIIGQSVTSSFTTCEIGLPEMPPDPKKVHVVVLEGGVQQDVASDLGSGGGWVLASDYSNITLHGPLCERAKLGEYEKISVVFGCVDLPPLDPPTPPE